MLLSTMPGKKFPNKKFHENPSGKSRTVTRRQANEGMDGLTDKTKRIGAFRKHVNVPKNNCVYSKCKSKPLEAKKIKNCSLQSICKIDFT
jgi:hypothetical protein